MTIWKIVKKIIRNCSLQKTPLVKNLHIILQKSEKYLHRTTACKKVVQNAICKKSCMIKTSGELRYTFLGRPSG